MGHPRPLFRLFRSFQTNINTILQQINVKKCPSSIRRWDSNPQPSDRESPSIITRAGHFLTLKRTFLLNGITLATEVLCDVQSVKIF